VEEWDYPVAVEGESRFGHICIYIDYSLSYSSRWISHPRPRSTTFLADPYGRSYRKRNGWQSSKSDILRFGGLLGILSICVGHCDDSSWGW
jgi:hypothetical protein